MNVARILVISCGLWVLCATPARAQLRQEDVLRSINENVGNQSNDGSKGLGVLVAAAGALIVVLVLGSRVRVGQRTTPPRGKLHMGKLLRELTKTVPLKRAELKQLKLLAEHTRQADGENGVESPLTLVLCPSVLAKALKDRPARVDRSVIAQVVRKMGPAVGK